jgi:hypothetical protein
MDQEILNSLKYFSYFNYSPTFDEIYRFFPKKISKKELQKEIKILVDKKLILEHIYSLSSTFKPHRYTLGEYSIKVKSQKSKVKSFELKYKNSEKKIKKIQTYIKILSFFLQIQLVGLSGTVGMMNANKNDDIDLFIITAPDRLWTGRFIAILFAQLLGLRRKRGKKKARDKVCLNLFFDGKALMVPDFKKTGYVAREILQMKPIINKNSIYEKFLQANLWIKRFFPNNQINSKVKCQKSKLQFKNQNIKKIHNSYFLLLNSFGNLVENILKRLQLISIKRHQTKEIISFSQLWFFPKDFERKVRDMRS